MLHNKLIDGIIKEPLGGAHRNPEEMSETMRKELKKHLDKLMAQDPEDRIKTRIKKFCSMGVVVNGD
jgi:acetyl-CoA carboxylase carboxyl transferase subunit alpha